MITDDSLDNFLQVRGFPFRGMVGFRFAATHPTLTHATLAILFTQNFMGFLTTSRKSPLSFSE